jgi:ParB-like chromosome segregation protein Spo0J
MNQIKKVKLEELIPYAKNSRTHSDAQVAQIAASIREFGFTSPVLIDKDGGIIAGHGRVMAARKLKLDEVPCIELRHLTDTQKRAYIIADNKLALNSSWDDEMLRLELDEPHNAEFDMALLGFEAGELAIVMGLGADFDAGTEADQGRLDEIKATTCPACGHEFHK